MTAPRDTTLSSLLPRYRPSKLFTPPSASHSHFTSLDFSDDGTHLITTTTGETLELYDVSKGTHTRTLFSKKYGCHLARFTHTNNTVIYASTKENDTIRYLSLHDNSFIRYFKAHTSKVNCLEVSPVDDQFISCSHDGTAKLWDLKSQHAHGSVSIPGTTLAAFDPSGIIFALASYQTSSIMLFDLRNYDKAPFQTFSITDDAFLSAYSYPPRMPTWQKLEFSNDGKLMLLGTRGQAHYVVDSFSTSTNKFLWRLQRKGPTTPSAGEGLNSGDVTFTPDGRYVVGGQMNGGVAAWDVLRGGDEKKTVQPWVELKEQMGTGGSGGMGGNQAQRGTNNALVAFSPKVNVMVTADREALFWIPEQHAPDPPADRQAAAAR
ncbi:WD40 repeat-like protein [Ascodesmis nigricans]|uniref:WD40 repeat-like protein n=1 Tax=Ascodesmis nigricans TaxID=341454 RepID=A0A4S2N287_9PEZI|nr:WD40 repeat-like protein [Ascodesmis nigricans]